MPRHERDEILDRSTLDRRLARGVTAGALVALVWGALAFGAVYPWAFTPLLVASLFLGVLSFAADSGGAEVNRKLTAALLAVGLAVCVQLTPLPPAILRWMSPATDGLLRQYNLAYATPLGAATKHPLSIAPQHTLYGLAFLAC